MIQDLFDEVSNKALTLGFLADCFTEYLSKSPDLNAMQAITTLRTHAQWLMDSVNELGEMIYKTK